MIYPALKKVEIEKITESYIKSFQPSALSGKEPFNVEFFLEYYITDLGIDVHYTEDLPPGVYGLTDSEKNTILIRSSLIENDRNNRFARSTIAHEVGHAILHIPFLRKCKHFERFINNGNENEGVKLFRQDEDIPTYRNPEWQAWHFAKAILMPYNATKNYYISGYREEGLSETFNVNPAFAKSRIKNLF